MLEDLGNAVRILDTIVPAVNIQVEGVPGYLTEVDGQKRWYGIYFEVLFEDGRRWEVEHGFTQAENGRADDYAIYVFHCDSRDDYAIDSYNLKMFDSWEQFLEAYKRWR